MVDSASRLASALADHYRIDREIGTGGMATVYLAEDLKHHRKVALKVLRPELAAALGPERFLREIEITARLDHPHILPLLDSGQAGEFLYYVMPLVEGESLRDRLTREKQLPLEPALQVTRQVADALGYAHAHQVIHRDIKPENILLSGGHARVADFGIARAIDAAGGEKLTQTGLAIGTPAYMSPEQSLGEGDLDGRSDLYSLGCVLYEMLAGEPPFTGATAQAVFAKRLSEPVPHLGTLRAVPPAVEQAVTTALARAPVDRFATAAEFAAALTAPHVAPAVTPVLTPRAEPRYRALGLAALVLAMVAGAIALLRRPPSLPLDANLVAVAPFEVLDPSLELWREGMGDVLSRYLDGAGPLSTVSQTVVLRRWTGRPDLSSAEALARRTGAGLVVFGQAVPKGGDSVLLRATVLRMAEGGAHEEIEVAGETGRLGALADSLGRGILDALGRTRPIGAVRLASLGAGSLPALKAFLRGEQLYRQGRWDSALVQYERALALDSGFALPNRRMAAILWFDLPTTRSYKRWDEYALRAELLNRGLSARDSLLIVGLASWAGAQGAVDPKFFAYLRETSAAFEAAVNRYPADPEAWYFLGEFRFHNDSPLEESLAAFDHAIALDSSFATSYEHTVELALRLGQPELARRYANARLALSSDDAQAAGFRLDSALLDPRGAGSPELARLLDTTTAWTALMAALNNFSDWPDSAETAVRIARIFPSPRRDYAGAPDFVRDSLFARWLLATTLARRGHLREAYRASPEFFFPPFVWAHLFLDLALFGVVPAAVADAGFRHLVTTDSLRPPSRQGLPWWLARGDSASLTRYARRADSIGRERADPLAKLQLAYVANAARAYLALLQGDSTAALKGLEALPDSLCLLGTCFYQNLTRARLLSASGRDREAARVLDQSLLPPGGGPWFVVGMLERGRVAERLNDREKAALCYGFVLDAWRNADPELQPYVAEARDGLVRLTGEPRR